MVAFKAHGFPLDTESVGRDFGGKFVGSVDCPYLGSQYGYAGFTGTQIGHYPHRHGGISEKLGGLPSLTAVLVLLTGMVGAIFGPALFKRLSVRDDAIKGVALGVAAHGIGTARAFQLSDAAGAFAGLAMGLTALLSALLLPFLAPWVLQHLAR